MVVRLDDVDRTLRRLELILLLVVGGRDRGGAAGGALISRAALVPVRRLTETAERIAETGEPSERVPEAGGHDEISRLGTAFNTMLAALEESIETQRRFVADASHELRTPLTSLQTNIEVLKQQERLAPEQRARLFADLEREAHEMRDLIAALLELARGDAQPRAVDRAARRDRRDRRRPGEGAVPERPRQRPSRADNGRGRAGPDRARSMEPARERRQVDAARLERRRHARAVASCACATTVPASRRRTASTSSTASTAPRRRARCPVGLGLAIVREVAEAHGGSVSAEEAPGGGALLRLRLAN